MATGLFASVACLSKRYAEYVASDVPTVAIGQSVGSSFRCRLNGLSRTREAELIMF